MSVLLFVASFYSPMCFFYIYAFSPRAVCILLLPKGKNAHVVNGGLLRRSDFFSRLVVSVTFKQAPTVPRRLINRIHHLVSVRAREPP